VIAEKFLNGVLKVF